MDIRAKSFECGVRVVTGSDDVTQSFELGAFEVQDMRHFVVHPGGRVKVDPSADVDFVTVIAGVGVLRRGEVIESLSAGVKTKVDGGESYTVEATGSDDLLLQVVGARASRRS